MTYHEFMMSVLKSDKPAEQRFGQWAFNMLSDVRPDLCDMIVHESLNGPKRVDPFNNDKNLYAFWEFVEANW